MSKWNRVISPSKPDTVNRAGGEAFTETPEVALVNLVLTSFMKDKFYEAAKDEAVWRAALSGFSEYALAKYRGEAKALKSSWLTQLICLILATARLSRRLWPDWF